MLDPRIFDDITRRLKGAAPDARSVQGEFGKNLRAAVQAALARLDLVTREEFDVQAKVLARPAPGSNNWKNRLPRWRRSCSKRPKSS